MSPRFDLLIVLAGAVTATGCQTTTTFTAANISAPVLVGPVRPTPRAGQALRRTRVEGGATHSVVESGGRHGPAGYYRPGSRAVHRDDASVFDVALAGPIGDCFDCWTLVEQVEFSTFYHLAAAFASFATIRAEIDVVHVLSDAEP